MCNGLSRKTTLTELRELNETIPGVIVHFWRTFYPEKVNYVEWLDWMDKKDETSRKTLRKNSIHANIEQTGVSMLENPQTTHNLAVIDENITTEHHEQEVQGELDQDSEFLSDNEGDGSNIEKPLSIEEQLAAIKDKYPIK